MDGLKENNSAVIEEREFGSKSISVLFWKYSMFALAGLSFTIVQTFLDGAFVGNGIGMEGFAVISVTSVLWQVAIALFGLFGIGGSTLAAIKLGSGDKDGARAVYGNIMFFSFISTAIICFVIYLFLDQVMVFIGATPEILESTKTYSTVFLIGLPFCVASTVVYYITRVDEKPLVACIAYAAPAIIAIVIEYYMIFKMDAGIGASAFAMEVAMGMALFLVLYLQFGSSLFKLRLSDMKPDFKIILDTCKIGFAMFIIPFSTSAATIATNNMLIESGGNEMHLAAFGTISYMGYFFFILTNSFITGMQPIASYNYGAKRFDRIRTLIRIGIVQSSAVVILLLGIAYFFKEPIILFLSGDPALLDIAKPAVVIYMLLYAFGNVSQIVSGYYMSVERNAFAILNGIARMTVFAVPLIFILPKFFGVDGVWMAQPVADTLSCVLALVCMTFEYKRLGVRQKEGEAISVAQLDTVSGGLD